MGLEGANTGAGNTKFLTIAAGAIWDKKNLDVENEFYAEEEYEKVGGGTGIRKGCKYRKLTGYLNSVFFKDTDFGELMDVYIEDKEDEQMYCLAFKVDGGWTAYSLCKNMIIALMQVDKDKPFSVNVTSELTDTGFLNVNLYVTQDGKSIVLNPNKKEEHFNEDKHIAMSDNVKEMLGTIEVPTVEERKVMKPKQKIRAREDELESIKGLLEEFFLEDINAETKDKQAKETPKAEVETKEPEAEVDETPAPPKEAAKSKADKLAALKARMKK